MVNKTQLFKILINSKRVSGWLLLIVIIIFYYTGYIMTGRISGLNKQFTADIHTTICWIAVILIIIHVFPGVCFWWRKRKLWKQKKSLIKECREESS